jgi:adenylate cyclase
MEGRIPFRVAIVTLVVGLLAVTCGALILYALYQGRENAEILKREYLDQVAQAAASEVARLPRSALAVLRFERDRFASGRHSNDPVTLARELSGALQAVPEFRWVSYGDAAGRFAGAYRLPDGEIILNVSDPRQSRGIPRELRASTGAPYVQSPPLERPYDPRERDWYRRASAAPDAVVWLPPYVFAEGVTGITAAAAVRDAAQRVQGVVTVDFTLEGIERFLAGIKTARQGVVMLFDRDGVLLAGAPGPGRDAAVRAVKEASGEAVAGGETWSVVARPLALGGVDWKVAAAVREEAFMGPVYANRRAGIVIALLGVGLALVAGTLLATGIARELSSAAMALDRVAKYQLEEHEPPRSRVKEIFRLERAVRRVTASLRSFTRYAPEEIVRDVVATGREAMLTGDRREVTVLFSDLRGFTGFAAKLPPEEVVAILNDHFELLVAIISRHGGFVVDFLGDAVFAVFGAPEAHADHVERAVTCAIDMQRARIARSVEMRARGWPPMEMGVGIDTGTAVVGNMGSLRRIKYGVVGHVVNTAARIETFTVGGQVLVSEATKGRIKMSARGPLEVEGKGVGTTLRLWEVLPAPVHELAALSSPLEAGVRLILGKQVDTTVHPARVLRLGAAGAELESDAPLAVFGALQVLLDALALDGKVVELSGGRALVRFTGLDWEIQGRIEAQAGGLKLRR